MHLDTSTDPQVGFRPSGPLDSATALDRYRGRFGPRQAAHLARRAGFGEDPAALNHLIGLGVDGAVDSYIHPTAPDDGFTDVPSTDDLSAKNAGTRTQLWWLDRMLRTKHPLVEKMTLFWHGHFATSMRKVAPPLMARQIATLRANSLGTFPRLLLAVSQDPAMLVWLDNRLNVKAHPNENYAREVMELFALGLGNYTEDDIREAARAFTGWGIDRTNAFVYRPTLHDDGVKTILNKTGPWTGEDAVAIIVSQPISQRFIARKLLEFFVYSDPEPELIEAVARVYALGGFDIGKTVATILRSNVFFSQRAYRALPKSPIEFAIGTLRGLGVTTVPPNLPYQLARMGQEPLVPPSVKGWDGGPAWINTSTLLARFNFINTTIAQTAKMKTTLDPDTVVGEAGGLDVQRVVGTIVAQTLQDDVTSETRARLIDYADSRSAAPTGANPLPFGAENYQEKIRGVAALTLNLPVNQLN